MTYDSERIAFLDVEVYRGNEGTLGSNLYRKPTAGNTSLHVSSFHPQMLVNSIPYSQYLRTRQNCSDDASFKIEAQKLCDRLLQRGYSHASLKRAYQLALSQERKKLIYTQKPKNYINPIGIITRYTNQQSKINNIVNKYWHTLSLDSILGQFVPDCLLFTFKRAASIRDKLITSKY